MLNHAASVRSPFETKEIGYYMKLILRIIDLLPIPWQLPLSANALKCYKQTFLSFVIEKTL